MTDPAGEFGNIAQKLARNPLGIIALFIVLVYGIAGLVTGFSGSFPTSERLPLIYFLVVFPVLVLGIFTWLVSRHSNALFAPSDFRDEDNYVKALTVTAKLTAASAKDNQLTDANLQSIVASVQASTSGSRNFNVSGRRSHVLWVDDLPENNVNERAAFEALGVSFTLALSTTEALDRIEKNDFAVIISDMGRAEGPREGYVLLDQLRKSGNQTPLYFYASSREPEHVRETLEHDGQGLTNQPQELFRMVMRAIVNR